MYIETNITFFRHCQANSPREFEEGIFVFAYLWPNPYYQIDTSLILSSASLATGVTAEESSTQVNTPSPSSASGHSIPTHNPNLGSSLEPAPIKSLLPRPLTASSVNEVLHNIRLGTNLDHYICLEGNITYRDFYNLDQSQNPHLYVTSSGTANGNLYPPCCKKFQGEVEEEAEETVEIPQQVEENLPSPLYQGL